MGGAFKVRGATNAVAVAVESGSKPRGVVTYSSGNHAQGCAIAARACGLPALVVMPQDAPSVKVEATRAYGAEVRFAGFTSEDRRVVAEQIERDLGYMMVRPFNDVHVVAGQGTVGLEIMGDCPEVASILVPCGGGGLTAGVALAATTMNPSVQVISAESEAAPKMARSMSAGRIVSEAPKPSIADGLRPNAPGDIPFAITKERLAGSAVVSDAALGDAVSLLLHRAKLLVEPSGAAGVAALMTGAVSISRGPVVVVLSGGNVDPAVLERILKGSAA